MAAAYLTDLQALVDRLAGERAGDADLTCRHFFGGAAAYADGRIFMTLTAAGLTLKLPAAARAALIERGAAPLRYFPRGPIKKDYVIVPENLADDALAPWVEKSLRFCRTLPAPRRAG